MSIVNAVKSNYCWSLLITGLYLKSKSFTTYRVTLYQTANCSRAEVLPQRMFCRQKSFVCDRWPVFECRQNVIVWHRRQWWVGSRQSSSSGRGPTETDEPAWWSCSWRAVALEASAAMARHQWDVVASSRASDQPGRSVLHRLQTSHQLVRDAIVQCVAPVQTAGNESLDHRPGGIHGRSSESLYAGCWTCYVMLW